MGLPWTAKSSAGEKSSAEGNATSVPAASLASSPPSENEKQSAGDVTLESGDVPSYQQQERRILRKLDLFLLPGVCILYLLSFLDRSNIANARLEGLTDDLNMSPSQYNTSLTIFFIGYILFEVFWNIILKRIGPRIWLPLITLAWGIVATLTGVVQNNGGSTGVAGFFVIRFLLGVTEGGLFPGVCFYLSMWYKRAERQYRIALFFSAASLAGAFGGILAYGIGKMSGIGGYKGWRWIFIIEGLLTVVLAAAGWWYIADWPDKARFITEEERSFIQARLKSDSDASQSEEFEWSEVIKALKDYKVWLYCAAFHTLSLPLYTLSFFLPSIIKALGYQAWQAQLLSVPPYVVATLLTVVYAVVSEKVGLRAPFVIASSLTGIIGYAILLSNTDPTHRPGVSYVGVFFAAAGIYPSCALALSWPAMNVSGQTKRAVANGLQITIGNIGAIIGTQLYRSEWAPRYVVGHSVALAYLFGNCVVAATLWYTLDRENKKRDRIAAGANDVVSGGDWQGDEDPRWRFRL